MRKLFTRSWVTKTPPPFLPALPVALSPHFGSATVRVKTACIGVAKSSLPSMKNGRFSGKNRAKRSLTSSCDASASTCEKSGSTAAPSETLGVMPQRAVKPTSASSPPESKEPPGNDARTSVRWPVKVGSSSRLRPGRKSAKPTSLSYWQKKQPRSRSYRLLAMRWRTSRGHERPSSMPQVSSPPPAGKRICLKGTAISTTYPSSPTRPAEAQMRSKDQSPTPSGPRTPSACTPSGFTRNM